MIHLCKGIVDEIALLIDLTESAYFIIIGEKLHIYVCYIYRKQNEEN